MKVKLTTKTDTLFLISTLLGDYYEPLQSLNNSQKMNFSIWIEVQEKIRKKVRSNVISGRSGTNVKDTLTLKYHEAFVLEIIVKENIDLFKLSSDYEKTLIRSFLNDLNQKLA
jgi:hypothetical protein